MRSKSREPRAKPHGSSPCHGMPSLAAQRVAPAFTARRRVCLEAPLHTSYAEESDMWPLGGDRRPPSNCRGVLTQASCNVDHRCR